MIRTLVPFSMRARSHTATSLAYLLNSRTCTSRSEDHLLTISSIVLPLRADGGGTATTGAVDAAFVAAGATAKNETTEGRYVTTSLTYGIFWFFAFFRCWKTK